jgi:hypothetical protein
MVSWRPEPDKVLARAAIGYTSQPRPRFAAGAHVVRQSMSGAAAAAFTRGSLE